MFTKGMLRNIKRLLTGKGEIKSKKVKTQNYEGSTIEGSFGFAF
jgi:hypothetical protein